jgi:hypothetical protein
MKRLFLALAALFFVSQAFAVPQPQPIGSGAEPECSGTPSDPRQKWVVTSLGPVDVHGQPYTITLLLLPEQMCDTERRSDEEKALCREHWELIPYEQTPLQDDEILMSFGSTCARITEASLCVFARGLHRAPSSDTVINEACHRLWQRKYLEYRSKR